MNYVELFAVSWRFVIYIFPLYSISPGSCFCFRLADSVYFGRLIVSFVSYIITSSEMQSKKEDSMHEVLCQMLDEKQDLSTSDSKIWFALEHPKVVLFVKIRKGLKTNIRGDSMSHSIGLRVRFRGVKLFYLIAELF